MKIRLERRLVAPRWLAFGVPAGSLVAAIVLGAIVLLITGHDPLHSYRRLFDTAFVGQDSLSETLTAGTPLLFTGLAAAVAFRMSLWNVGAEGQLYCGAIGASGVGLWFASAPTPILIAAMAVAGMLAGAAWALIPALLRAYASTNEIITSLMLNYVAGLLLTYLIFDSFSYWRDTSSFSAKTFPQGKTLPDAGRVVGLEPVQQRVLGADGAARRDRRRGLHRARALADAARLRDAGDRRLETRRPLRRHPHALRRRSRLLPLGRLRGPRGREPGRRLPARARSRAACSRRASATRASSSPRSRATTRSASCWWPS